MALLYALHVEILDMENQFRSINMSQMFRDADERTNLTVPPRRQPFQVVPIPSRVLHPKASGSKKRTW